MFNSIIKEAGENFNSGGKSAAVFSALLRLMANPAKGGINGFIEKFWRNGLGDAVESWISTGANKPISNTEVQNTLGTDAINAIAAEADVDRITTTSLLGFMIPRVVDELTPDGELPTEEVLLSKVIGFSGSFRKPTEFGEIEKKSIFSHLSWSLPLVILLVLIGSVYWFFKSTLRPSVSSTVILSSIKAHTKQTNDDAATEVDSVFKIEAVEGKYVVSGVLPDLVIFDKVKVKLEKHFGANNVDFKQLRVEPGAKSFADGWWDNFGQILPDLKDWKSGTIAFAGKAITAANGLPKDTLEQIKSLFEGWIMPVSIAGTEVTTRKLNEEALKRLQDANTIEQVIYALNLSVINFKSGSSEIPADAKVIFVKASEILKKQPEGTAIEISGYTDNQGNAEENKKLSQNRADAVKKILVGFGVSDLILKAVGYGDADPLGDNNTEDGRFKNRRIKYKKLNQ